MDGFFFFFGAGDAAGDSRSSASLAEGTRSTSSSSSGGVARGGAPDFSAREASSRVCLHLGGVSPGSGASANGAAENNWPASLPTEGLKVELERRGENRLLVLRNAAWRRGNIVMVEAEPREAGGQFPALRFARVAGAFGVSSRRHIRRRGTRGAGREASQCSLCATRRPVRPADQRSICRSLSASCG